MSIPKVNSGEKETDFIGRCMKNITDEYEQDQAAAICYSTWRESKNMSESEQFRTLPTQDCEERHKSAGYTDEYIKWACKAEMNDDLSIAIDDIKEQAEAQQSGVVNTAFGRTKFEFPPLAKEKMSDFMGRCMSDSVVREKKQDRIGRARFCYSEYQNRYVMTIGRNWK